MPGPDPNQQNPDALAQERAARVKRDRFVDWVESSLLDPWMRATSSGIKPTEKLAALVVFEAAAVAELLQIAYDEKDEELAAAVGEIAGALEKIPRAAVASLMDATAGQGRITYIGGENGNVSSAFFPWGHYSLVAEPLEQQSAAAILASRLEHATDLMRELVRRKVVQHKLPEPRTDFPILSEQPPGRRRVGDEH